MAKTILITGATDGIGRLTAKKLKNLGHKVILHGRNPEKLKKVASSLGIRGKTQCVLADFSNMDEVRKMVDSLKAHYARLDVLINNAGVYKTSHPVTSDGYDLRYVVNLFAPVVLTQNLLPLLPETGRVVNLSSAAQSPVDINAMRGDVELGDMPAYAQSKRALTMWTREMAKHHPLGPAFFAVNPGSLLATNMVKEGWGMAGNDINIGANILVRAALADEFEGRSGEYFDNDAGRFAQPDPDSLNPQKIEALMTGLEAILAP